MKNIFFFLVCPFLLFAKPKALHITFHAGCDKEIEFVCKQLGIDLTTWNLPRKKGNFLEGRGRITECYNMTHKRAKAIFNRHKMKFHEYDLIITSDIAPLSRIFLQNNWKKPLIIWVCNRFDINPLRTGYKVFPDPEYYELFREAKNLRNVEVVGYCGYEAFYAKKYREIDTICKTIEPTGAGKASNYYSSVPKTINKPETFFVRNYRNELLVKLHKKLKKLHIPYYRGSYNGSCDLKDFKGMVHIPLVMGNFHLWENLNQGIVHFIPSKQFYKKLYEDGLIEFWDWISPAKWSTKIDIQEIFDFCDWYDQRLAPLFVFFDSFEELQDLTLHTNYAEKKAKIKEFTMQHTQKCLEDWREVFGAFVEIE